MEQQHLVRSRERRRIGCARHDRVPSEQFDEGINIDRVASHDRIDISGHTTHTARDDRNSPNHHPGHASFRERGNERCDRRLDQTLSAGRLSSHDSALAPNDAGRVRCRFVPPHLAEQATVPCPSPRSMPTVIQRPPARGEGLLVREARAVVARRLDSREASLALHASRRSRDQCISCPLYLPGRRSAVLREE